jgi:maleamate amidohydrolase
VEHRSEALERQRGDPHEPPHFASLHDMAVKYADVLPLADVVQGLAGMQG